MHEMHCFPSRQKQNFSSHRFIITYTHMYAQEHAPTHTSRKTSKKGDGFEKNILIRLWDTSDLVAESCKGKQKS